MMFVDGRIVVSGIGSSEKKAKTDAARRLHMAVFGHTAEQSPSTKYSNVDEFVQLCEEGVAFDDFHPTARELWSALCDAVNGAVVGEEVGRRPNKNYYQYAAS